MNLSIDLLSNNTLENLIINNHPGQTDNLLIAVSGLNNQIIGSQLNAKDIVETEDVTALNLNANSGNATSITVQNSIINAKKTNAANNTVGVTLSNAVGGEEVSISITDSQINAALLNASATGNVHGILTIPDQAVSNNVITLNGANISTVHNGISGENSSIHFQFSNDIDTALNSQFVKLPNLPQFTNRVTI